MGDYVGVFVVVVAVSLQDRDGDGTVPLVRLVVAGGHAQGGGGLARREGDRFERGAGDVVSLLGDPHVHVQGPGHGIGLAPVAVQGEGDRAPFGHRGLVCLDAYSHEVVVYPNGDLARSRHRELWTVPACLGVGRAV